MTNFTCPHCGLRTSTELEGVELVDLGNGLPDAAFPPLAPGVERHINMRLCCSSCYEKADPRPLVDGQRYGPDEDHPYHPGNHAKTRLARPVGTLAPQISR